MSAGVSAGRQFVAAAVRSQRVAFSAAAPEVEDMVKGYKTRGASVRLPKALGGPVRVGQTIDALFEKFLDHRDAGGATVVLSHVSLLVAVAAPRLGGRPPPPGV